MLNYFACLCVRFVMKTDDDAFVNMFSLLPRLRAVAASGTSSSSSMSRSSPGMLLLCNAWRKELVAREGKWSIARSVWRYDYWPTFCQGLAFIMTMNFAATAYQLVHRVPQLWLDDVSQTHGLNIVSASAATAASAHAADLFLAAVSRHRCGQL